MSATSVRLGGLLGDALEANRRGRLSHFITGPDSPAIAIFDPDRRDRNEEGDWYGEHAGKWLAAAAKAAARSDDAALQARVLAVADHLVSVQAPDGYLGNYAPQRRFMVPQPPKPESWNGEPALRTWDIWTHSYLILGFLETWRALRDVSEVPFLAASSSSSTVIGMNTSCSSNRNNAVGSCMSTLVSRT